MRPLLFRTLSVALLLTAGHSYYLQAQIFTVSSGTSLTISGGTSFAANGVTLTPSSSFTLGNGDLRLNSSLTNPAIGTYISRVYLFSGTTSPFTGSIEIDYLVSELNGLSESSLNLNVFNGTAWAPFASSTNNTSSHYAVSIPLSNVSLKEMTLAGAIPLPLTWLSFSAIGQTDAVLLQWSTANEQNTKNFEVQRSMDGSNWDAIGILPAAGYSNQAANYTYRDEDPGSGVNYYRIRQIDLDDRSTYSTQRVVEFTASQPAFTVFANPVTNGVLQVLINKATPLSLYSNDGRLIWKEQFSPGMQYIDVSRLAKHLYFLKGGQSTVNILIR